MKRLLLLGLALGAGLVWAGAKKNSVALTTAAPWGVPPSALTDGIPLSNVDYVQCSVHGIDSTFSAGSVCWYRNPNETPGSTSSAIDGDAGWEHIGAARQTATNVANPDGGAIRRYSFQSLKVGLPYGRIVCVACPLTGTADDGGQARFTVRTEGWAK